MCNVLLMLEKKENVRELSAILAAEKHKVIAGEKGIAIRGYTQDNPEVIIVDSIFGNAMIDDIRKAIPYKPIICLLPEYDARLAVDLLKAGAFDCIYPPLRRGGVNIVVNHAIRAYGLRREEGVRPTRLKKFVTNKRTASAAMALLLAALAVSLLLPKPPCKVDLPYNDPTSIVYDDGAVWIGNWYTQSIYRYKENDCKLDLRRTYYFSDFGPLAVARLDNYIWTAGTDFILRQHIINENLDVIRSFKLKDVNPSGMAFIGNNLWVCDSDTKKIHQYYVGSDIMLVNSYNSGLSAPVGLYWDGQFIWIADAAGNKLYLFKQKMDNLELAKIYRLPRQTNGVLAGLCIKKNTVILIYAGNPSYVTSVRKSGLKSEI